MATTAAPRNLANPNPTQPATTTAPPPSSGGDELNKAARASKTGSGSDDVASVNAIHKKMKRAERFGVPVQLSEEEKRNSRAERFGTASGGASKSSEELKKKARAERFGIPQAASGSTNEESKKKARLERFGVVPKMDSLEDEKKKARAIRFSESQSNSKARQSGGGAIESKTMGEAGVV